MAEDFTQTTQDSQVAPQSTQDFVSQYADLAKSLSGDLSKYNTAWNDARSQAMPKPQPSNFNFNAANSTPAYQFKNLPTQLNKLGAITTNFGGQTNFEKFHPALDIANKMGTPIPSLAGGQVIEVSSGHKQGDKGYGNYVKVKDANGNVYRYSHLKQAVVKVGDRIGAGDEVGEMGNTGSTYSASGKGDGTHLDLRIQNAYGQYVNPLAFLRNS